MKTKTKTIIYYKKKGSPWFNRISEAKKWLEKQEDKRLEESEVEIPTTKWEIYFVNCDPFFNLDIKVVEDRQPLLGTGPLPDWLRNLSHSRNVVTLDTFQDNLCLWRCIAVHRGARPDRCTNTARLLAKAFFRYNDVPKGCPKTSLDQLDKVEQHLNRGKPVSEWFGIWVYEPERLRDGRLCGI